MMGSHSFTDHLMRVLFPVSVSPDDRCLLLLTAFFDDGGHRADRPVVSVGGFMFYDDGYRRFEEEWLAALDDFDLSKAKGGPGYFRMSDFAGQRPPYDWPKPLRHERLDRLLGIIERNAEGSFGTAVPVALYDRITPVEIDKRLGGPFGYAAAGIFWSLGHALRSHPTARVSPVFETGSSGIGQVAQTFQAMTRDDYLREFMRLETLAFATKQEAAGLHAADILAFELYRHVATVHGLDSRPSRPYVLGRLRKLNHSWGVPSEEQMRQTWQMFTVDLAGTEVDMYHRTIRLKDGRVVDFEDVYEGRVQPS